MSSLLEQQIEEVVRMKDVEDLPYAEIGKRLGFSARTAQRRYEAGLSSLEIKDGDAKLTEKDLAEWKLDDIKVTSDHVPEDKVALERFKPMVCYGDAIVTCDFHIPLHDPELINDMISQAKALNIKKLVIAGDYFNMDSFSSYLPHQPEAAFPIERFDGNVIMKTLLRTFDEIWFFWGNHDFRFTRSLGYKKSFTDCMKWVLEGLSDDEMKKIHFSDLDYMEYYPESTLSNQVDIVYADRKEVRHKGRKFRICHPANFSSIPLTVPRKLAMKYACSIITAHSHHCAMGVAPNGYDLVIDAGGFFNKQRTEYIQRSTAHHEWVPGYAVFKNGVPKIISPVFGNHFKGVN